MEQLNQVHIDLEKPEAEQAKQGAGPSAQTTAPTSPAAAKALVSKVISSEPEEGEVTQVEPKDAEEKIKEFLHGQPDKEEV